MNLYWTSNRLRNVGLPAARLVGGFLGGFGCHDLFEAGRLRVFLLAIRSSAIGALPKDLPQIDASPTSPWNGGGPAMASWLQTDKPEQRRLQTLDNVVVPAQASLAMAVLCRMARGDL